MTDTYTYTDDIYSCSELEYPSFFRPTRIIRWSPNNLLESKWGIFDRYSFCCPSCPGCPRTVTRPLKSAPRRRHRPTAQPLRATSCPHDAPTVGRPAASTTESPPSAQPSASSARTGPRARPRAAFSSGECGMATGGRRCAVQTYRKYPPWISVNY